MHLVLFRHGDAGDRDEFAKTGEPDELRPLSDKGRAQVAAAARGLKKLVRKCDLIATSPLTRARQTADLIAKSYGCEQIDVTAELVPGKSLEAFVSWAKSHAVVGPMIVVGHEPHLGDLATWLRGGKQRKPIELKKGGACLIEFDDGVAKSAGDLVWLLGPKKLAKGKAG